MMHPFTPPYQLRTVPLQAAALEAKLAEAALLQQSAARAQAAWPALARYVASACAY